MRIWMAKRLCGAEDEDNVEVEVENDEDDGDRVKSLGRMAGAETQSV